MLPSFSAFVRSLIDESLPPVTRRNGVTQTRARCKKYRSCGYRTNHMRRSGSCCCSRSRLLLLLQQQQKQQHDNILSLFAPHRRQANDIPWPTSMNIAAAYLPLNILPRSTPLPPSPSLESLEYDTGQPSTHYTPLCG